MSLRLQDRWADVEVGRAVEAFGQAGYVPVVAELGEARHQPVAKGGWHHPEIMHRVASTGARGGEGTREFDRLVDQEVGFPVRRAG